MISLIKYFDIDPHPDASITVYCDNVSALRQVDTPLWKCSTRHRMVPEYDLVNELKQCINKTRLDVDPEHVKGHQYDGFPVDSLPYLLA